MDYQKNPESTYIYVYYIIFLDKQMSPKIGKCLVHK